MPGGQGSPEEDPADLTLAAYREAAGTYVSTSRPPGPAMTAYLDGLARLVGRGPVLEIGSGPGWDADHLEARGVEVVRTDATPAFVERLRAAGHRAELLDVRTGSLGGPYRAVMANAVLLHLSRPRFEDAVRRARRAVTDDGFLALTLKEGDGEAWSSRKLGVPRHYTYWREPDLREALARAGWTVASLEHVPGAGEEWLYVVARA